MDYKESITYPVKYCQIHPHQEHIGGEVDSFWQIAQQLVVKTLHEESITALMNHSD